MCRVFALAALSFAFAAAADACESPYGIHGLIYEDIPSDTPTSALVLDVALDWPDDGPLQARVRRVLQGEYAEPTVRIGVINSSCLYPFIFGTEGLIIGEIREGVITHAYGQLVLREGFEGVWFRPTMESVAERRDRTGVDPLTRAQTRSDD